MGGAEPMVRVGVLGLHVMPTVLVPWDGIDKGTPVTSNDLELMQLMLPSLLQAAGPGRVYEVNRATTAEDFAYYQKQIPRIFFFLGTAKPNITNPAPNHLPISTPMSVHRPLA